jgi:hypothetical protein
MVEIGVEGWTGFEKEKRPQQQQRNAPVPYT